MFLNAAQILQCIVRFAFSGKVSSGSWLFTAESGDVSALGASGGFCFQIVHEPCLGVLLVDVLLPGTESLGRLGKRCTVRVQFSWGNALLMIFLTGMFQGCLS